MPDLTLEMDKKFDTTLSQLVQENPNAQDKVDIVQRAVATYKYFHDAVNNNMRIQLVDVSDPTKILQADVRLP